MIARVFPRKTNLTPDDNLSFVGSPDKNNLPDVSEIHISVTFSYDKEQAEQLYKDWSMYFDNVKIGGVAYGDSGKEFTPGMYLKKGNIITSRGCPNKCWFCDVWKREGNTREYPVYDGYNLLDSNILACSDRHIVTVFKMLEQQKKKGNSITFTGGLESARLKPWHVELLWNLRPKQMFFAYDTPDDLEPLFYAGKILRYANFTRSHLYCYVLIGYQGDTIEKAKDRLINTWSAGFLPFAMLWRGEKETRSDKVLKEWEDFQRSWTRPPAIKAQLKGTVNKYLKHLESRIDNGQRTIYAVKRI